MSAELLFALGHLGPRKILGNLRAMKAARSPLHDHGFRGVRTWSVRNPGARVFVQCDA